MTSSPASYKDNASAGGGSDDAESDKATTGSMSVRSTLSTLTNGTSMSTDTGVRTPYTPITHTHVAYVPLSVEKHYKPVVYGEFLLSKVGNNFATGKGKYD